MKGILIMRKMQSILALIGVFLFLFSFPGFADEDTTSPAENQPPGVIRGMVRGMILKDGRVFYTRLPDVKVSLEFTSFTAQTRDDGRFRFSGIPPGEYTLVVGNGQDQLHSSQIIVHSGRATDVKPFTVYLGTNKELPSIMPGSMVAAFASPLNRLRNGETSSDADTPTNGLVFYNIINMRVYLEIILETTPLMLTYGRSEKELYLATEKKGLELWDLVKMEPVKEFDIPGIVSDLQWNPDRSKLYVSYFNEKDSGIIIINGAKREVEQVVSPPPIGLFSASYPINNGKSIIALLTRIKDGRLLQIDFDPRGNPLITKNRKVGELPTSMTFLPANKNIMIISGPGKSVVTLDSSTFQIKNVESLEGKPVRIIDGFKQAKAYLCLLDKNTVIALDGRTGKTIASIPVGAMPFQLCRRGYMIYAANRDDRTISVIDGREDRVMRTTPPENYYRIMDLDLEPGNQK